MTPAEVLNKAADMIERQGWWNGKGEFPFSDEPQCAELAMYRSAGGGAVWMDARDALCVFTGVERVPDWNDRQPNGEVVIKALRDCAKSL